MKFIDRVKKGWNVFSSTDAEPYEQRFISSGSFSQRRPDRIRSITVRGKDITNSIYTRFAVDAANVDIRHVKVDDKGRFKNAINSGLNRCFSLEANIDQGASAFKQDIFQTMLEEGTVVLVPMDTEEDPESDPNIKINTMRVGTVVGWLPEKVRVRVFREEYGRFEELTLPKSFVAPIENPFYSVMNEANSTLQRLTRKISLLDKVDEQIGSGKLDLIIQLPYIIKSDTKKAQAEKRRGELEDQLKSSQYGVAYADGTEKIVQLNRPVENNLLKNVEALTNQVYSQLGITEAILNGTADEKTMLNYQNRIIKPMLKTVTENIERKFISLTGHSQGQRINYFLDPFSLVPVSELANIADLFTRNAILSSNEFRGIIGFDPVDDPMAEALVNKNMPVPEASIVPTKPPTEPPIE